MSIVQVLSENEDENQTKYLKDNDLQTLNIMLIRNFNNTINDELKNETALIVDSFIKTETYTETEIVVTVTTYKYNDIAYLKKR